MNSDDVLVPAHKVEIALGRTEAVPGVPALAYVDGPNGVRGADGATAYPSCLVLAATFDRQLAMRYGASLAAEVKAAGANVLLGPGFDILRVPWSGRSAESFGEDPLVAGEMGGTVVGALQGNGVLSVAKHFVANNFEWLRTGTGAPARRGDSIGILIDERTLREIYLEPFRRAVVDHGLRGLMTSYNRVNGDYVAQSPDLLALPREEWGFAGVYIPDYGFAVRDPERALASGLDLPALGYEGGRTAEMVESLSLEALDTLVDHVIGTVAAVGMQNPGVPDPSGLGSVEARELAERIATDGAVLLRNQGLLPLDAAARVALIAPDDLSHLLTVGGSGGVQLSKARVPSLADELRRRGLDLRVADPRAADVPLATLTRDDIIGGVIAVEAMDEAGGKVSHDLEVVEYYDSPGADWTASVEVEVQAKVDGIHRLSVTFAGRVEVRVTGAPPVRGFREASPMIVGPDFPLQVAVDLTAGERVRISLDYSSGPALDLAEFGMRPGFRVGWEAVGAAFASAVEVARDADAVVAVVGRAAGEGMDTDSIHLPAPQERLLDELIAVNPNVVVVVLGSGPIAMPWREHVRAILQVGNPGERGAPALADILLGHAEPGGRLPFTIPLDESRIPLSRGGYPGDGLTVEYAEGLRVGYRGYDAASVAYPFGHGLGYAELVWEGGSIERDGDGSIVVRGRVRNASGRIGKAVPQLYVTTPEVARPRGLVAFDAARVPAGATWDVEFIVNPDLLARFDVARHSTVVDPGEYRFDVGFSSADAVWSGSIDLPAAS